MSSNFTFLVVDDDEDSRYLNRHELKKWFPGSTVVEAASVGEALDCSARGSFDAVVTDHHLGAHNGDKFVADLRLRGVICPIVMVTSNSDPSVHERGRAAGATRVFGPDNHDFGAYLQTALSSPSA